jgi:hypothetical protein
MQQRNFYLQRMNRFLRRSPSNGSDRSSELPRPSLTISRQCGTRCNEIRRKLVEYLDSITPSVTHGWACFGQCVIGKLIEDRRLDGVGPSFSEKTFNFQSLQISSPSKFAGNPLRIETVRDSFPLLRRNSLEAPHQRHLRRQLYIEPD